MLAAFSSRRVSPREVVSFDEALFPLWRPGELVDGTDDPRFRDPWKNGRCGEFSTGELTSGQHAVHGAAPRELTSTSGGAPAAEY